MCLCLVENKIKSLFLDCHSSHQQLAEYCSDKQNHFYCLLPNATHTYYHMMYLFSDLYQQKLMKKASSKTQKV